jgi:16S rRNA processing protein RimM
MPGVVPDTDLIPIARIGRYRGTRGEVFIFPYLDLTAEPVEGATVELRWRDGRSRTDCIERLWWHGGKTVCQLRGSKSIDDARALTHAEIFMARNLLSPLEQDQFYAEDLAGLMVRTIDGRSVGRVEALVNHGASTVLQVRDPKGREILIPFVAEIVTAVDVESGEVVIDPPAGLLEINVD